MTSESAAVPVPWLLSGTDGTALRAVADRLHRHLAARPELTPAEAGRALVARGSSGPHRAVVVVTGRTTALQALATLGTGQGSAGQDRDAVVRGVAREAGEVVFVFPGQGPQWCGMGGELLDSSAVFREAIDDCAEALAPHVGWPLHDVLRGTGDAPSLDRVDVVQPALFAMMMGLAALWRAHGVEPAAVVGHSLGEIPAACVAGGLSLADGARIVALWSGLQAELAGQGEMASVPLPAGELTPRLTDDRVGVAAVNGPSWTVVSGDAEPVRALVDTLQGAGVRARLIPVGVAAHSPHIDAVHDRLLEALRPIRPRSSAVRFFSTVTGTFLDTAELDAAYWCRNLRDTVRFSTAVRRLAEPGDRTFVEISPHPVLTIGVQESAPDAVVVGTTRRFEGGLPRFFEALAELHVRGTPVSWPVAFEGLGVRGAELPDDLFRAPAAGSSSPPVPALRDRLAGLPDRARHDVLVDLVLGEASASLGGGTVTADRSFWDAGFDSVIALDLRNRLSAAVGMRLPATLVFDHPTPARAARHLATVLSGDQGAAVPAEVPAAAGEPIAVVAMSCRFPGGVRSPEGLWELVLAGRDAVTPFPRDRGWDVDGRYDPAPGRPGRFYQRDAGLLESVTDFDAAFFGISPREATAMDPQQRVLLELGWEVLERAGIDPGTLRGTRTGVFVGAMALDYGPRLDEAPPDLEGHVLTGGALSVASGRLAFTLGLQGPAVTVDTACSSSLVAVHLACQALRGGECSLALAGGATVMPTLGMFIEFSRMRGLAPDGRCKAFAASADGFGLAEGAGLVLLERLSDAERNGHRVLAVIPGSAINQDGASNGLTAPNGPAQEQVIRAALADARLAPGDIDAVEAHGTGTTLGDPIEARALLAAYGRDRAGRPLWLGSVKSNIGHAQAAAGIAGIIKMVLALEHGLLPRTLHVDEPSPHVDWALGDLRLLTEAVEWPSADRPRRAAVSSFGISGTNAHLILQRPEGRAAAPAGGQGMPLPVLLSAATRPALRAQARHLHDHLAANPDLAPERVSHTLATRRAHLPHRAAIVATDRAALLPALSALAEDAAAPNLRRGSAEPGRTAFVYSGQGGQYPGMGRELYGTDPTYTATLDELAEAFQPYLEPPLQAILANAGDLHHTANTQPALFAIGLALTRTAQHHGIHPHYLTGHSLGELTAAHIAGLWDLHDTCKLIATRARLMGSAAPDGAMVAVQSTESEVAPALAGFGGRVELAAVNSAGSLVLSGDRGAVEQAAAVLAARGFRTRSLQVSHAFHSAHMEEASAAFRAALAEVTFQPPTIPFVSALTGEVVDPEVLRSPDYWARQMRHTVRFDRAMAALRAAGVTRFLEMGPLTAADPEGDIVPMLRRGRPAIHTFVSAAARLHVRGGDVAWETFGGGGDPVDLPTYPFQRERYWWRTGRDDVRPAEADRRYRIGWRRIENEAPVGSTGRWLVLHPGGAEAGAWIDGLTRAGAAVDEVEISTTEVDRVRLATSLRAHPAAVIFSLLGFDETPHPAHPTVGGGLAATLALAQALDDAEVPSPLWLATRGAVGTGADDPPEHPGQAATWGLGRVLGLERPDRWGGLIDLPPAPDTAALEHVLRTVTDPGGEDEVAVRASGRYARRLLPAAAAGPPRAERWRPSGTVLITGGTGALG
ncbi:type I polyketide synthase, partial [Actinomadura fibrosa]